MDTIIQTAEAPATSLLDLQAMQADWMYDFFEDVASISDDIDDEDIEFIQDEENTGLLN